MSQTEEKYPAKHPLCNQINDLIAILYKYEEEQVCHSFIDMQTMCTEWLQTNFADERVTRSDFIFSLQIILELGVVVKAIPQQQIRKMHQQMRAKINYLKNN